MTEMFTDNADLSGVLESGKPLQVSDVIHKAFIEVTEQVFKLQIAIKLLLNKF